MVDRQRVADVRVVTDHVGAAATLVDLDLERVVVVLAAAVGPTAVDAVARPRGAGQAGVTRDADAPKLAGLAIVELQAPLRPDLTEAAAVAEADRGAVRLV